MRIDLDMPISCTDGAFGELADIVIDPLARRLTHLVVVPSEGHEQARLIALAGEPVTAGPDGIALATTIAQLRESASVQESALLRPGELPAAGEDWDVGIQEMYDISDFGGIGPGVMGAGMTMEYDQHVAVTYHRIPKGSVEIRRASMVLSSDGHYLGHVVGIAIDEDRAITQLVIEHGHLWGKRIVEIPGSGIERFEIDELELTLTGDEVGALPSTAAHHWWS